jgi:hypothetical protein
MYRAATLCFSFLFANAAAQAQPLMAPIPSHNTLNTEILNGKPADPKSWPVSLQFESAGGFCTSTLVGERVILTAAHCVANNAQASVFYDNNLTTVTCHHHPQYKGPSCLTATTIADIKGCTADVALCVADAAFPSQVAGQPVKFESVNGDPAVVKKDGPVVLLGYGCTQPGGSVSAILRIGSAKVNSVSVPGASSDPSNTMQEYIVAQGGSAVCQGDSGGAAFNTQEGSRRIVGVNSRGNIATISFLTSTSDQHIQDFFKSFSGSPRNLEICGVTQGAKNCR